MFEIKYGHIKFSVSMWTANTADYLNGKSTSLKTNSSHTVISFFDLYQTTIVLGGKVVNKKR